MTETLTVTVTVEVANHLRGLPVVGSWDYYGNFEYLDVGQEIWALREFVAALPE